LFVQPPPARGYRPGQPADGRPSRSTPACAGLPAVPVHVDEIAEVHPRLRGAAASFCCSGLVSSGPPPPARGYPPDAARRPVWVGSTPACAGLPCTMARRPLMNRVHPRLRGATRPSAACYCLHSGPPPPARGYRTAPIRHTTPSRSTPAYAGPSRSHPCDPSNRVVHPRLRGAASIRR